MNDLEKIIREVVRAVLQERGIQVVASGSAPAGTRAPQNNGKKRELSRFELASLRRDAEDTQTIATGAFSVVPQNFAAQNHPQNAQPIARVLAAVCCSDCLSDDAKSALQQLEKSGFTLTHVGDDELQKSAPREEKIAAHDVVLLPAVGDDDAAKMAAGIFDEPVTRTALAALASSVPVYLILHAPYAQALRHGSPNLARVLESNRRALQNFGFNVVEAGALSDILRGKFAAKTSASTRNFSSHETRGSGITFGANLRGLENMTSAMASTRGVENNAAKSGGSRVLITAQDIDRAARSGEALDLSNAIITPLARDRARELDFAL